MRLERARAWLRQRRDGDARRELQGLPGPEAQLLRAFCEPPGQRLQALQAGEAQFPDHPGFLRAQADILARQGRTSEATSLLEQALPSHRGDAALLRQLVRLLQASGRHAESLVHLRSWGRLAADDPEIRLLLGRVHAVQGRAAEARRAFLEHLQLRPEAHHARLELARLLLNESGRPEEALPLLDELEKHPEWQARVAVLRGLALARCDRFPEAEQVLRPLIETSQDAGLVAQYAQVLAALGHLGQARQWARRALELDAGCREARELLDL